MHPHPPTHTHTKRQVNGQEKQGYQQENKSINKRTLTRFYGKMSASSSSPSSWQLQKGQQKENKLVNEQRREGRSTWKNAGVHIHKNLSMFSCSYPCFLVDTLVFLAHSPVFFSVCVGGVGDACIPISSTSPKTPTISNKVHVLSSVLLPYLLHFEVELRSCPHTQTHTR